MKRGKNVPRTGKASASYAAKEKSPKDIAARTLKDQNTYARKENAQ
jgi:hypothetical protein